MPRKLDRLARSVLLKCLSPLRRAGVTVPEGITKHLHYRGKVEVRLDKGKPFCTRSHGHAIENRLYWYGRFGHEPETFIPWLKAAAKAKVVLDIGANTGLYSLGAAAQNPATTVFAFEPLPRVARMARENAALNPGFKIEVCENAVSDACGQVTLHDPGGDQPASASQRSDFLAARTEAITVEAITIDEFVTRRGLSTVDLIKLDVEGVEELALRGMRRTLERFRPTLFIEVLDDRPALMAELQSLLQLGYQVGDLRADGVVAHKLEGAKGQERNLLFTMDLSAFQAPAAA